MFGSLEKKESRGYRGKSKKSGGESFMTLSFPFIWMFQKLSMEEE